MMISIIIISIIIISSSSSSCIIIIIILFIAHLRGSYRTDAHSLIPRVVESLRPGSIVSAFELCPRLWILSDCPIRSAQVRAYDDRA